MFTSAHEYKKHLLQNKPKTCRTCGEEKSRDQFSAHGGNHGDGLFNQCKPCISKRTSAYSKANPEKVKQRKKNYYAKPENKAKARKYAQDYRAKKSAAGLLSILHGTKVESDDQEGICYWCGTTQTTEWHRDHIMPLHLYGCHQEANLVNSCETCNTTKGAQHPLTWLASLLSD